MFEIKLVSPTKEHEKAALEYIKEHLECNEVDLHGGAMLEKTEPYTKWLERLEKNSNEKTVVPGCVTSSTFFVIRKNDNKLIGMIDIRHRLNTFLAEYGGHIGYGVCPSERGKGYGTQILQLGLAHCEKIGLTKVMVACYKENEASSKIIRTCGGVFEREFLYTDGKIVQIFWITI